jgi:hypothetical protein
MIRSTGTILGGVLALTALWASFGPTTGALAEDAKDKKDKKAALAHKEVSDLYTAAHLIHFGRNTKSAAALVLAAEILGNVSPAPGTLTEADGKTKLMMTPLSPKDLLTEARKMDDTPAIANLAEQIEKKAKERGSVAPDGSPKPMVLQTTLRGQAIYEHTFSGPSRLFVYAPGGVVTIIVTEAAPGAAPRKVAQQTGTQFILDWVVPPGASSVPHKIMVSPTSAPPITLTIGSN